MAQIETALDAMVAMSSDVRSSCNPLPLILLRFLLANLEPRPDLAKGVPPHTRIVRRVTDGQQTFERLVVRDYGRLSENFALFAAAVDASRLGRGRLSKTIERIAHSVRELRRLEPRKIRSGRPRRPSAMYCSVAMVFIHLFIYYFFFGPLPELTERLFDVRRPGDAGAIAVIAARARDGLHYWAQRILETKILAIQDCGLTRTASMASIAVCRPPTGMLRHPGPAAWR